MSLPYPIVLVVVGALLGFVPGLPKVQLDVSMAGALGLGTGAVFRLVAHAFPDSVGAVSGVVGAAGGLGGFFPAVRDGRGEIGHGQLRPRLRASGPHRRGRCAATTWLGRATRRRLVELTETQRWVHPWPTSAAGAC